METMLTLHDVKGVSKLSRSSIYKLVNEGLFPQPIKIFGSKSIRWVESEVAAWLNGRIAANRATQQREAA